jgi:hypothetical protein
MTNHTCTHNEFCTDDCPNRGKLKQEEYVTITEYYTKDGICRKRTANGVDLPADTEPSVQFLIQDIKWVEQKMWLTKEEFKNRFKEKL